MGADELIRMFGGRVHDRLVLDAIRSVPRQRFVPASLAQQAWENHPLPIGQGQTISQPLIVALMTEALQVGPGDRVLEIGTGSGYQAAVLAQCGVEVFTIEVRPELADGARRVLEELGYAGIHYRVGNGRAGWPEEAPFEGIIATAAGDDVPSAWLAQLRPAADQQAGGRLVLPVESDGGQELQLIRNTPEGLHRSSLGGVRFVPLVD